MIQINQNIHILLDWDTPKNSHGLDMGTYYNDKYTMETTKGILEVEMMITSAVFDKNTIEAFEMTNKINIGLIRYFTPNGVKIPLTKDNYNQVKKAIENKLTYE